ncbi:MAG: Gfo/Idh/MocA family oxidoreductase [Paenibacillaceae bacterium]|nr:Gfo/Idh/MocA family oxidoreductase [Paenibacillaceae bacterium]
MTIKVAMLSYWHVHAKDYTRQVQARPECQIVAVWDELPDRGRQMANELGVPFYEQLQELLDNPDIDAVVVDTPSNLHAEVMIAAANAGKHIFTEKVLAITTADADRIIEAVNASGKSFMISLPRLTENKFLYAKQVIDEGLVGDVTLLRIRLAHDGALPTASSDKGWLPEHFFSREQCGGGALIDLGCHPMYLAAFYLGMPKSVTAQFGHVTGRDVEDNAVSVLAYENGALAVVEAGFASRFSPFSVEVHGTEGCLLIGNTIQLRSRKLGLGANDGWVTPDRLPAVPPQPLNQWVDHIVHGTAPTITIEQGRQLTMLMEASNRSAAEGRTVVL